MSAAICMSSKSKLIVVRHIGPLDATTLDAQSIMLSISPGPLKGGSTEGSVLEGESPEGDGVGVTVGGGGGGGLTGTGGPGTVTFCNRHALQLLLCREPQQSRHAETEPMH